MKHALALVAGLFAALFLLSSCSNQGHTPEQAAVAFTEALAKGDAQACMDLLYLEDEIRESPHKKMQIQGKVQLIMGSFQEQVEENGGIAKIEPGQARYEEDPALPKGVTRAATVVVTIRYKKSEKPLEERQRLYETKDGWKVRL